MALLSQHPLYNSSRVSSYYSCLIFERLILCYVFTDIVFVVPCSSWCFCKITAVLYLIIHYHDNGHVFCIIYLGIVYFSNAGSKSCRNFVCYLLIACVCLLCCYIFSCSGNCYGFLHKYVCVTAVTNTWL